MKKEISLMVVAGLVVGVIASVLVLFGNPGNMGFCIACFIRDTAGALKLQTAAPVKYIRPEIIGLVLGSFILAISTKEFSAKGGSSPLVRFVLGCFVTIGALVFLGCPLRMALRIAGGDLNAIVGLVGFVIGILIGIPFLKNGFSLGRTHSMNKFEGSLITIFQVCLFLLLIVFGGFLLTQGKMPFADGSDEAAEFAKKSLIAFSTTGPGSMHAPIMIALIAGLIVGALAQKSRLCMVGGIRDIVLFKDFKLITGFVCLIIAALVTNVVLGKFHPGFTLVGADGAAVSQPIAHSDGLWNALSMALVGFASVLLGGCPLRQLILAGEGNVDSAITCLGLLVGAAFAHNFGLASGVNVASGVTANGKVAVVIGFIFTAVVGFVNMNKPTSK